MQQVSKKEFGFVLHDAVRKGALVEVSKVLIQGHFVNQEDKASQTPLHLSAQEGFLDITKFLIEKYDANIHAKDKNEWTPLHSACFNGHIEVARYLLSKGAKNIPNNRFEFFFFDCCKRRC